MGRVALITGASSGIGAACADRLHARGWVVVGASRRGTSTGGWTPIVMDVDDEASVRAGVRSVLDEHGPVDAVLTCAGWGLSGPVEMTPLDHARAQVETNFWGSARVVAEVLPAMRRRGAGRIVLMSSIGGLVGLPFQAFYSASKFALEGYGEALAYEVQPFGVWVTLVEPGNVRTDFTSSRRRVGDEIEHPYREASSRVIARMEHDERTGPPPERVAAVVERVLGDENPPLRLTVGTPGERAGVVAKRLLPQRLFGLAARRSFGV